MSHPLRLATRGSALALTQASMVEAALAAAHPGLLTERHIIQTSGDRFQDRPLAEIGGKALFTREIDNALLNHQADIAVHSLKDVPSAIPPELMLAAVLPRADVRDVLIVGERQLDSIDALSPGTEIGTSSPRRALQLTLARPDLRTVPIRGNVPTRLNKAREGLVGATLLAAAGMLRLGLPVTTTLSPQVMLPAVGQGIVVLACRRDDTATQALLAPLNHQETWRAMLAERALLSALDGNCHSPIAAWAEMESDRIILHGFLAASDGSREARHQLTGTDPETLGQELAALLQAEVPRDCYL